MARGDVPTSPWAWECSDYLDRHLRITVPWDDSVGGTRNILSGTVVHRDPGCLWNTVTFDVPIGPNAKRLPAAPEGDTTLTAQQIRSSTGFRTIDDLMAVQITAETV